MSDVIPSATVSRPPADVIYPSGDGKPMAETSIHVLVMLATIGTLREYYRHRPDVFVIGNIFLYYEEGHPESRRSPDVMVVKGVEEGKERRSFKTWEERAMPSVIIEITSDETSDEDLGPKRELYERLGVREYFLFDPLHDYLERPLIGYRLIQGKYESLPPAEDGGILSSELGLRLVPEDEQLGMFFFRTGERVPSPAEVYQLLEQIQQQKSEAEQRAGRAEQRAGQAEQRAGQAEQRAGQAEQRAGQAEQRAGQAEQQLELERRRAEELAAELARLRALLPPTGGETRTANG